MNCTVDAAASQQGGVRSVHDGVDFLTDDVSFND
jgi:hypothetical protein